MHRISRFLARLSAALLLLLPVATPAEDKPALPAVQPALWKVADEDTTIYLFGTVHVLPPDVSWYGGKVAQAFEHSQELVTEILETGDADNGQRLLAQGMLPEGQTLRALMRPEERKRYEKAMAGLGMPAQSYDRFEPWLAAMSLSIVSLLKAGYSPDNGVDSALAAKAGGYKIDHKAFETYDYQIGLFDSLPIETQKTYLAQVAKDLPTMQRDIGKMIDAWKSGDADGLAKMMNAQEDFPGMFETLLINRNKAWADQIEARMKQPGTVFVAVGAGHLAGAGSVQDQLAKRGIKSERVQ